MDYFKDFPPGWGHLKLPVASRGAALAGLAMYAPCKTEGIWVQRAAWAAIAGLGTGILPGRRVRWTPPMIDGVWQEMLSRWSSELGRFNTMAIYERLQGERDGVALLLIYDATVVSFVKVHDHGGSLLSREALAQRLASSFGSRFFHVPEPIAQGCVGGWEYLATRPLAPRPHRIAKAPPLRLITAEIQRALADFPRSQGIPLHWLPMHGDFSPWNLRRLSDGQVVLVDWEAVGWGPPGADEVFYRATSAALRGEPVTTSYADEAIAFWQERLSDRRVAGARDRKLGVSLVETLARMRAARSASVRGCQICKRPRVLVFAYACEPERGSEPGAGWGLVRTVSEFADCVVLVAPEHTPGIRAWERRHPTAGVEFVEIAEPAISKRSKWHRIPWFLLYLAWLGKAYRVGKKLHAEKPFDAVFHATYATYWLPTPATRFGVPCVWGPVGGATTTPLRLWPLLGWKGVFDEIMDRVSVRICALLPSTRRTWRRVAACIVQNPDTLGRLSKVLRGHTHVLNHTLFVEVPKSAPATRGLRVLFVSGLESRKGAALVVRALASTPPDICLGIVGDGPDRSRVERLVRKLGLEARVEFLGARPRGHVFHLLQEASVAVFAGLREEGGMALAEAMLAGTPTVVLANGGPLSIADAATDPQRVAVIQPSSVDETARRMGDAITHFVRNPPRDDGPIIDQTSARERLRRIFEDVIATVDVHPQSS